MRKKYLDNIRWITVVLVVIYHVMYLYTGVLGIKLIEPFSEVQYQDAFLYAVYPWFMVLLFTVSGMSSRYALEKHTDREFVKARTQKLLVPSTIGLFVFQWITGYFNMVISSAFMELKEVPGIVKYFIMVASGIGPLWFIQLLWLYSILLVLIRKFEKDRLYNKCEKTPLWVVILLGIGVWASSQVLNTPVVSVYRFGIYGFVFFVGYFVLSHDNTVEKLSKYWIVLCITALTLGILFVQRFWGLSFADLVVLKTALCNAYAWITVLAILAFMYKYGNFENKFTFFMKRQSWSLYLFHYLFAAMTGYYLNKFIPNLNPLATYLCVGISAFTGPYILNLLFSRTKVLRWCILGEKNVQR